MGIEGLGTNRPISVEAEYEEEEPTVGALRDCAEAVTADRVDRDRVRAIVTGSLSIPPKTTDVVDDKVTLSKFDNVNPYK
ncbi:hypothetical protein GCM10007853_14760 [Algimonas ampicilliniresistens]|uniref:Uncharacterized protein n=1 Tax=Algimonas ampicilliniresistens TaxID=1298735 RepID=A0ABQ5VB73_9PROT|nr:hypothetical protein GCM10007853_14760 [Algimonas ampicilliniresistens]